MITNDLLFREQPQCCYIEFPTWPLETAPYYSPRKPKTWGKDEFYVPVVPPYRSYEKDTKETIKDAFLKTIKEESRKGGLLYKDNFSQTK